jgi:hypothetical protein
MTVTLAGDRRDGVLKSYSFLTRHGRVRGKV